MVQKGPLQLHTVYIWFMQLPSIWWQHQTSERKRAVSQELGGCIHNENERSLHQTKRQLVSL